MATLSSLLPVADEAVPMTEALPKGAVRVNGLLLSHPGSIYVVVDGTATCWHGGIGFADDGAMLVVNASSGLPAGVSYLGGLPVSADGELCVDADNAVDHYVHGIPISSSGSVTVSGITFGPAPSGDFLLLESGSYLLQESGDKIILDA